MAVPSLVNSGGINSGNSTTASAPLPGSRVNGNLLLAFFQTGSAVKTFGSLTSGWTFATAQVDGPSSSVRLAWRYVDGSETAPSVSWTGSTIWHAECIQLTGVQAVTPIGNTGTNSGNGTTISLSGLTSSQDNSLVVAALFEGAGATSAIPLPISWSSLTVFTDGNACDRLIGGSLVDSGSTAENISVTISTGDWQAIGIEVLGSGSSGPAFARATAVAQQVLVNYVDANQARATAVVKQVLVNYVSSNHARVTAVVKQVLRTEQTKAAFQPSFVVDADTFYSPTVSRVGGTSTLTPSLVVDTDTFYSPSVVGSDSQSLAPSFVVDADAIYQPAVSVGGAFISPIARHDDQDTFYSPTITLGSMLSPSFVVDTDIVFQPRSGIGLVPTLFQDVEVFYAPTITTGPVTLHPSFFQPGDVFYTPTVQRQGQQQGGGGGGGGNGNAPKDKKYASSMVMAQAGLITDLGMTANAAATVNSRMMIYADATPGANGALLGYTVAKSSVVLGSNVYHLAAPVAVTAGQTIWIALQADGNNINWALSNSPQGSRFNNDLFSDGPSDPFGAFSTDNKKAPLFAIFLEAVNAQMLPPLVDEAITFFSPTLTTSREITPPLMVDQDFVIDPTVSSVYFLDPARYVDVDDIFAAISTSSIALTASLVDVPDEFFAPAVQTAELPNQEISMDIHVDADVVFPPAVAPAQWVLSPSLVVDQDFIHELSPPGGVTFYNELLPELVEADDDIPTVSEDNFFIAQQIVRHEEEDFFWDPTVTRIGGTQEIAPDLYVDDDAIYAADCRHHGFVIPTLLKGDRSSHASLLGEEANRGTTTLLGDRSSRASIEGEE